MFPPFRRKKNIKNLYNLRKKIFSKVRGDFTSHPGHDCRTSFGALSVAKISLVGLDQWKTVQQAENIKACKIASFPLNKLFSCQFELVFMTYSLSVCLSLCLYENKQKNGKPIFVDTNMTPWIDFRTSKMKQNYPRNKCPHLTFLKMRQLKQKIRGHLRTSTRF